MSCFCGQMREYRNLSIDRFDGRNLKSKCFFLSHIHEDHTVGLDRPTFLEMLQASSDVFLYCSEVTKLLLLEKPKYSHLEHYVKVLPIDVPNKVSIPQQGSCKIGSVEVTLINASHCPGSVMFLFDGQEGICLYTGDFRWDSQQITNIPALHDKNGSVKHIDSLYIDTTFCHESSIYIPSREDSANAVYNLVKEWIGKGPNYVVHFKARTQYGHEHLMKEVCIKTGHKVYVSKEKCEIYKQIPDLEDIFTSDPSETPVHACKGKWPSDSLPWGKPAAELKVMVILPSTMYFTMLRNFDLSHIVIKKGFINRVCYSFHSSYTEVKDLVTYLQPKFVRPNVKPMMDETIMKVQGRLNEFLKLKNSKNICDSQKPRLLGKLRRSKSTKKRTISENSSDSIDLNFGTPEKVYPPAKKSRIMSEAETDEDEHSSYAGSNRSDSEMSDICELSGQEADQKNRPQSLSLPGQSLLDALDEHEFQESQGSKSDALECRVCIDDDDEQTTAVVVPTNTLEAGEYKIAEEEASDNSEGDTSGANKDDVVDNIDFDHDTTDDVQEPPSVSRCETLSTPGQSLLTAVDEMEAEVNESGDSIINSNQPDRSNSNGNGRCKTEQKKDKPDSSQDDRINTLKKNDELDYCEDDNLKTDKQNSLYALENDRLNIDRKENKTIIIGNEREDTKNIQNGSGSYKDNFINFLKNGNKNSNENRISKFNSDSEKEIDKMLSNERESESYVCLESNQSSNNRLNTSNHEVDITENKSNEVVTIIDSSCSTVCESLPQEVIVNEHNDEITNLESNSKSSRNNEKNQKEISSSYDLFGSDEGSDVDDSDNEIMITEVCSDTFNSGNKSEKEVSSITTNSSNSKEKGNKEELLVNKMNTVTNFETNKGSKQIVDSNGRYNDCVVLDLESEDEEERSLLSGKLSRSNSLQSKDSVNCQISSIEKCVTKAVDKLFSGNCQNTAIDCDDLSDSEETLPPSGSQQSDASIETLSPFVSPVKSKPIVGPRSLDSMSSGSQSKKSPMKNQSIKPYLSPVKNQSPQKVVCQMGGMFIMNNESDKGEESAESSMIDLTASDDSDDNNDDDKNGADDSTQDYYVID
ncbi:protein artemis-like [Mytilus edulis]|uniref:protein artemis-like n=1 Tax=Mytilus edulis TaxID=6550 RepID=UPI0039EF45A9